MKHTALALSDSPQTGSHTIMWFLAAQESSFGLGIEARGGPGNIPPHDPGLDAPALRSAAAGGVLIATPDFIYSATGTPKNALDRASTDYTKAPRSCDPALIVDGAAIDPPRGPRASQGTRIDHPRGQS